MVRQLMMMIQLEVCVEGSRQRLGQGCLNLDVLMLKEKEEAIILANASHTVAERRGIGGYVEASNTTNACPIRQGHGAIITLDHALRGNTTLPRGERGRSGTSGIDASNNR